MRTPPNEWGLGHLAGLEANFLWSWHCGCWGLLLSALPSLNDLHSRNTDSGVIADIAVYVTIFVARQLTVCWGDWRGFHDGHMHQCYGRRMCHWLRITAAITELWWAVHVANIIVRKGLKVQNKIAWRSIPMGMMFCGQQLFWLTALPWHDRPKKRKYVEFGGWKNKMWWCLV